MNDLTLQDLDRFVGWTLVAVAAIPKEGTQVRLQAPTGELVDIRLTSAAAFAITATPVAHVVGVGEPCPKSPLGEHALRSVLRDFGPGRVHVDPTQPRTCILCGQMEQPAGAK